MEYSANKLAALSGVSTRTLRYYDEIGLLRPNRTAPSGYRFYGNEELDRLQQILFYRELEFPLEEIQKLLSSADFDRGKTFQNHLTRLSQKKERLDLLIQNVTKSIAAMKGEFQMSDKEKFEGFKQNLVKENEQKYGKEIREKYGDKTVDKSNERLMNMNEALYDEGEKLRLEFEQALKDAFDGGDPEGFQAQKACALHRSWLSLFYPCYSKEYHKGLAEMYVADERFRANYDKLAPGCADFLREAILIYCR